MRVEYRSGVMRFKEWVAFEHTGFARQKACAWWQARAGNPVPDTVLDALRREKEIACPSRIQVIKSGKYFNILAYDFAPAMEVGYG